MSDERMELQVTASPPKRYDLDQVIFDLDSQIDLLQSHADSLDYVVAVGSGVLCALLDILWTGEFSLERGRKLASGQIDRFVLWSAKLTGYKRRRSIRLGKFFPFPATATPLILVEENSTTCGISHTTPQWSDLYFPC